MSITKTIHLSIYKDNLMKIQKTMAPSKVMAVVKADAYGHGIEHVAKAASDIGIELLGTLDIESALILRESGILTPCFAWLHSPTSNFSRAISENIELSASSVEELNRIADAGVAKVHLKVDTGLSRGGATASEWPKLTAVAGELAKQGRIHWVAVWSHLAGTSEASDLDSQKLFEAACEVANAHGFQGYRHLASSPGAFALPSTRYEMVRIGVSAFGTSPLDGVKASELGLGCPMQITTKVISEQKIGIGFLHGLFSNLSDKAWVSINGEKVHVRQIGHLESELSPGNYRVGDEVIVFGDGTNNAPTAEELCEMAGTITDEIFTGIKSEVSTYSL